MLKPMQRFLVTLCILVFSAAASVGAAAQQAGKVYRVDLLVPVASPPMKAMREALARLLAPRGYALGSNLAIEIRAADGDPKRLPVLAKELAKSGVDVIVTSGYPAARAAKEDAATVPTVAINSGDPVATGLAVSLSHPGGDLTGVSDLSDVLSAKRLELLKDAVPALKKVAMLWNADDLGMTMRYKAAAAAATTLGIAVQPLGVREPDDFVAAFSKMGAEKPDGILMVTDVLTVLNRKKVIDFAAAHHIPAIYEFDFLARDGGLMSYGPDGKEVVRRVADLVDRILKGAKPADLPFEEPTRFRFVVNQKTADGLGLKLPPSLLARADEVIE
jgi:putative ABC transport system substrate-binding protein